MSRLERKNRTFGDIGYKHEGGMFDLFDNSIKTAYRINDEEYDYICEKATDAELELVITETPTFKQKRQIISILNNYLKKYYDSKSN